jgi:hypothetical protein
VLGVLQTIYRRIVLMASPVTSTQSVESLRAAGVVVEWQAEESHGALGSIRRATLACGLKTGAAYLHLCDWDRVIHWAEHYPDELRTVVDTIPDYDCLILGRTERAFNSHPRVQRDTEALINHCFGLLWGQELDVTAASRGLSRRAAERLVEGCDEPSVGNDGVWPLFLRQGGDLHIGYLAMEGLEWETPDRYGAEIAAAGGIEAWRMAHDAVLHRWVDRVELARVEIDALDRWRRTFSL